MATLLTPRFTRRRFLEMAAAIGASCVWATHEAAQGHTLARESRDAFPQGVASGDPDTSSIVLWTRRPFSCGERARLAIEVSEDEAFSRVVASKRVNVLAAADWTCRVLVGNLKPARLYWYRFIDAQGNSSRIGRTRTAPAPEDSRPVRFAFCSCQNANMGANNAYRRMIFEDERAPEAEQLEFVLHLGDFVYEVVWYPEDRPQGYSGRALRDIVRFPHGEKIKDFHIPTDLEDYRALYRAYLADPDLQDARARWPFVCIWDNHEFSWNGWQSLQLFEGKNRPAQTRKVAANQAWFEYQPARVMKSGRAGLEQFDGPSVQDRTIERFDEHGFGEESNNRAAVASLTGYRALRWGRHLDLLITDQRSYRSEDAIARPEANAFTSPDFPNLFPLEALEILDAGRNYAGGKPPATIRFGDQQIPNFRKDAPSQTLLGAEQKQWFLQRLRESSATWKIWGNSLGTLDYRVDLQNLPSDITKSWPGSSYAAFRVGDYSATLTERAEIYATVRDAKSPGFATLSGDRHGFWAGWAAAALPPQAFEPVGVAFVTAAISSASPFEGLENNLAEDHPLRGLFMTQRSDGTKPEPTVNLLLRHGVRAALEYDRTYDISRARNLSNPTLAPHLRFLDQDGHGYATVRLSTDALECEFVCIPRPTERVSSPDGGQLLYRVAHRAPLWKPGETPRLEQRVIDGHPALSL